MRPRLQKRRSSSKLRKWSAVEDKLLINSVNSYLASGSCPDYRTISKRIADRSPKQCRERYENSLQPDVKRGEWSLEETITLAGLMTQHGQNWAAIKEQLKNRTYNAIKKKGRKILGEIVDRNSIPKGSNTKASTNWTQKEFRSLIALHMDESLVESKRNDYLFLALNLRTGRSEAEIERQLLQNCTCSTCSCALSQVALQECDVSHDNATAFKEKWSLWKAGEVLKSLELKKLEDETYGCSTSSSRSSKSKLRRASTNSATSTSITSRKRRRVIKRESSSLSFDTFAEDNRSNSGLSLSTASSFPEMPELDESFFGFDATELWLNLKPIHQLAEMQPLNQRSHVSCTPLSNFAGESSLKEFDLSFLLAQ